MEEKKLVSTEEQLRLTKLELEMTKADNAEKTWQANILRIIAYSLAALSGSLAALILLFQ